MTAIFGFLATGICLGTLYVVRKKKCACTDEITCIDRSTEASAARVRKLVAKALAKEIDPLDCPKTKAAVEEHMRRLDAAIDALNRLCK